MTTLPLKDNNLFYCKIFKIYLGISLLLPFLLLNQNDYFTSSALLIPILVDSLFLFILFFIKKNILFKITINLGVFALLITSILVSLIIRNSTCFYFITYFAIVQKIFIAYLSPMYIIDLNNLIKYTNSVIKKILALHLVVGSVLFTYSFFDKPSVFGFKFLGVFPNPAMFSVYLILLLSFFVLNSKSQHHKLIDYIIITFSCLIILFNGVRVPIILLFSLVAVYVYFRKLHIKFLRLSKIIIGGFLIVLTILTLSKLNSTAGHLLIYKVSTSMLFGNLWEGIGFNAFPAFYNIYQSHYFKNNSKIHEILLADSNFVAHSDFLELFVELGLILFVLFLFVLLKYLKKIKYFHEYYRFSTFAICFKISIVILLCFWYPTMQNEVFNLICLFFIFITPIVSNDRLNLIKFFQLNFFPRIFFLLAIASFICYILMCQIGLFTWQKQVESFMYNGKYDVPKIYFNLLSNNPNFLYTDASIQYKLANYNYSLKSINFLKKIQNDPNIMMLQGLNYQQLGQYDDAISSFKMAINMEPKRLRSKYYLMNLYDYYLLDDDNAKMLALSIIETPIKIQSFEAEFIRRKAELLYNRRNLN